jgi:hypothetical protein
MDLFRPGDLARKRSGWRWRDLFDNANANQFTCLPLVDATTGPYFTSFFSKGLLPHLRNKDPAKLPLISAKSVDITVAHHLSPPLSSGNAKALL